MDTCTDCSHVCRPTCSCSCHTGSTPRPRYGARWRGQYAHAACSACHTPFSAYDSLMLVILPATDRLVMLCAKCYQSDRIEAALGHPTAA